MAEVEPKPLKIMRPPDCMLCGSQMRAKGENVYECEDCDRVVRWMQSTYERLDRKTWRTVSGHAFVVVRKGKRQCKSR